MLAFIVAGTVATYLGVPLMEVFGWWGHPLLSPLILFAASFFGVSALMTTLAAGLVLRGGGLWSTSLVRWTIGKIAFLALMLPTALFVIGQFEELGMPLAFFAAMAADPFHAFIPGHGNARFSGDLASAWIRIILFPLPVVLSFWLLGIEKRLLAYGTLPLRRLWRAVKTGVGGSTVFDGLLDEWRMPWRRGNVILGESLYEPGRLLGRPDDRHMLTVATNRSGKGRACIIPNLLTWPGPCLVIDPKGQNTAVTALARQAMGQTIHILDPFGVLDRLRLDPVDYAVKRFNPLTAIDLTENDVVEQINNLADALIVPSPHSNPFWDNASRKVVAGVIAHVLSWEKLKPEERHLGTVREIISETNGRSMNDMALHKGVAGLVEIGWKEFLRASSGAGGDIMTTLAVHMEWLDSVAMRQTLSASDFELQSLKHQDATLYLVIPPEYLTTHARFLRLFITLALKAAGRGVRGKHPMLFILDEFPALGPLHVVEAAAAQLSGMGVKLWPIIQNLSQLKPYGDNWETFVANAGQVQVFAMNDQTTARYFSERLGHHISWRKVRSNTGHEWVPQGATWFRTSAELARESSRDSGRAIVFYEGGGQALVRRGAYDRAFYPWQYQPDPYEAGRRKPLRIRFWLFCRAIYKAWKQPLKAAEDAYYGWQGYTHKRAGRPWVDPRFEERRDRQRRIEAWRREEAAKAANGGASVSPDTEKPMAQTPSAKPCSMAAGMASAAATGPAPRATAETEPAAARPVWSAPSWSATDHPTTAPSSPPFPQSAPSSAPPADDLTLRWPEAEAFEFDPLKPADVLQRPKRKGKPRGRKPASPKAAE
ncbi:type IV secretory system conjugative DNA transfer family protein [Methylobacterium sp. E-065]|nr:type IV secretory system conjugative DNA transfer family protein [Methylobacterium sp. E-065]